VPFGASTSLITNPSPSESAERKRYRTIVCDPPWPFSKPLCVGSATGRSANSTRDPWAIPSPIRRTSLPYAVLSLTEILALPVIHLADRSGCRLFLWTPNAFVRDAFGVLAEWGFQFRQVLVWDKRGSIPWVTTNGNVASNSAEFLLVGTIGRLERRAVLPSAVIAAGVPKQHSRKPELFVDWIEQVSPGPYVELFARRHRLGWDVWGDESANTAQLGAS
jgi:N6-adenosine-specific RNA methylase IME4